MLAVEIDIKTAQRPASLIIINLPADLSMAFSDPALPTLYFLKIPVDSRLNIYYRPLVGVCQNSPMVKTSRTTSGLTENKEFEETGGARLD